jgi:adenylate kinase family enzyme
MQRIQICGSSGAGKSTLGRQLAQRFGLAFVDLDDLHWNPGWQECSPALLQARVEGAMLHNERWVLAGNYTGVTERVVWPQLDTLIVIDLPLALLLWRLWWRTWWRALTRQRCCNGNTESLLRLFARDGVLRYTLRHFSQRRERFATIASRPELSHVRVVHLRSRRELREFVAQLPAAQLEAVTQ